MAEMSLRERHMASEAIASFYRLEVIDGLWAKCAEEAGADPSADPSTVRLVADELDGLLQQCTENARLLQEIAEKYRSDVNRAVERLMSEAPLTAEQTAVWRQALEVYGDGASLASSTMGHLAERLPPKREELKLQRRKVEAGESTKADLTPQESCAWLVGTSIASAYLSFVPIAIGAAIAGAYVCGEIRYFTPGNGPGGGPAPEQ